MQDDPQNPRRIHHIEGCTCGASLDIDPVRMDVTKGTADGTTVTITDVPGGICARCGAIFFHPLVTHVVGSIQGLFATPHLGEIERSYREMVRRYWVHP